MRSRMRMAPALLVSCFVTSVFAQTETAPQPPDYRGVHEHIGGIFITPVPDAPFTAEEQIVSHEKLPDGTEHIVMTRTHIARGSSGVIRNERRRLVSAQFQGEPRLLEVHLYDPANRTSIFFDPLTHIARSTVLPQPLRTPPAQAPPGTRTAPPEVTVTDLGKQTMDGMELQGTRKVRVVPAAVSGTGQPVTITDEYWYAPELAIYTIIRHNDPRTGEQIVAVTKIDRHEPAPEDLTVPADYKVVDETPPVRTGSSQPLPAGATTNLAEPPR